MARIELYYGSGRRPVSIPDEWLGTVVHPQPVVPPSDSRGVIAGALADPIGSPPLSTLVRPGQRIAIIVDDYTRKTPVSRMLPALLAELGDGGARPESIQLVVALGTHRPMTHAELVTKLGNDIVAHYPIVNLPSTATGEMVYLGESSDGIPAWVQRAVAEADLRIGVGMITPHMEAGFSGGAKIVLPGVCSELTVDTFHKVGALIPENQLGDIRSPLRRNLEHFVAERIPLHFIVNAIITLDGAIYRCVAGDPIAAHRAGVSHALEVFSVPLGRRYPIVIASCYPYDVDWWQSHKGAFCGDLLTADGGTLILVTAAPEGNSTYPLVPAYVGRDPAVLTAEIEAGAVADVKQAVAGVQIGRLKRRLRLALVSDGLTPADAATMKIPFFPSVEEALEAAVSGLPAPERTGSVAVIPQAGIVLPVVAGSPATE
jgi:nickel-dependent lactate racemase